MKLRLTFLASVAVAMVLALVGVLNDVNPARALMPLPVQPFAADAQGGVSTTQLGQGIGSNYTITVSEQGERSALPWIFSGPGFTVDPDTGPPYDTSPPPPPAPAKPLGTVETSIDANCDGAVDYMWKPCSTQTPLTWIEATTNKATIAAGPDAFLLAIMPPWPWIARHKVDITQLCLLGVTPVNTISVLNTVYAQLPFSPGGAAFVAQTRLGGAPNTPPSPLCLDTPQSSTSVTTLYNNPALAGVDNGGPTGAGGRALDDNSGLYARWTILQSQGSSSLARFGDLRKSYLSPPSIPPDIGYVERTIDLQCFWIDDDGCDDCDGSDVTAFGGPEDNDPDGAISELESWNDPDLKAAGLGGIGVVDTDGDCLIQRDKAQPGQPKEQTSTSDEPTSGVSCDADSRWVLYSVNPVLVHHNTANDSDCDGLVDGIEVAYGSDPTQVNTDGDGSPDFVEMFMFTDPTDTDSDDDGFLDKPATTYLNDGTGLASDDTTVIPANGDVDNCPAIYNPDQKNTDGARRANGILPRLGASNPLQDKLGDACDEDWDNDGAVNAYETVRCIDATDGDGDTVVNDGCPAAGPSVAEIVCGAAVDNDSDGYFNDGCAAVNIAEKGAQCLDAVDANEDGAADEVNDGCPAMGPGAPETACTGSADDDSDNYPNDGCPAAGPGVPEIYCDNNTDDDGDGYINDGCPVKTTAEATCNETNCADANNKAPWDLCDDDHDGFINDGCSAVLGAAEPTDPHKLDTDGDAVVDGMEFRPDTSGNPLDPTVRSTWGDLDQTYYRGCNINVSTAYTGFDEQDSLPDGVELNPDGDLYINDGCPMVGAKKETGDQCLDAVDAKEEAGGVADAINDGCPAVGLSGESGADCSNDKDDDLDGECPYDTDSDNGGEAPTLPGGHLPKAELSDKLEAQGYNTSLTNADTDGDGCADWVEIMDLNGDRRVNSGDTGQMNKRVANKIAADPAADLIFDVNKDRIINSGDQGQLNKNTCLLKGWGGCPLCPAEY